MVLDMDLLYFLTKSEDYLDLQIEILQFKTGVKSGYYRFLINKAYST